jgi:antibiotic biosynthesis monooxygenase (ABM) superfamily enzyme
MKTQFVVDHKVPAANRDEFLEFEKTIEQAVQESPGCLGVKLEEFPPDTPESLHFRTTMEFDSEDNMVAWIDSDRRQELVHQAREAFEYGYSLHSELKGFQAWFPPPRFKPPPSWKMNLLVLVTLYPTVLALRPLLSPYTKGWDVASGMLLGNIVSVSITGWILIPLANKLWSKWMHGPHSAKVEALGTLSALAILAMTWLIFRG